MNKKILALCGSLRSNSSNEKLIHAAIALKTPGTDIHFYQKIDELPYFNPDLEKGSLPSVVKAFREMVQESDGILISTPEYAHGLPGVLKNALDWLVGFPEFEGKAVVLICGGEHAPLQLEEILKTMSAQVLANLRIVGPKLRQLFDEQGLIADSEFLKSLNEALLKLKRD